MAEVSHGSYCSLCAFHFSFCYNETLVTLHYGTVRTAWFYGFFSCPEVTFLILNQPSWHCKGLGSFLLKRFSSLSHELAFDTQFHKAKAEHLIADIIHDVLFYLLLTIAHNNLVEKSWIIIDSRCLVK